MTSTAPLPRLATVDYPLRIGLVSVSDRASSGSYQDAGRPALQDWLNQAPPTPGIAETRTITDKQPLIESHLCQLWDTEDSPLGWTTGRTCPGGGGGGGGGGLAVAHKEMPGFGEQMRQISLNFVPTAILSRQVAVIRGGALIINLPGQPKSIRETLEGLKDADGRNQVHGIFAAVPYCLDLIGAPYIETRATVCTAFRPKSAPQPVRG